MIDDADRYFSRAIKADPILYAAQYGYSEVLMRRGEKDEAKELLERLIPKFPEASEKLAFIMIDPEHGAFADETSLSKAAEYGAIPMEGYHHVQDIINSLV